MKKYSFTLVFMLIFTRISFAQITYEIKQVMDLYRVNEMSSGENKNFLTAKDIEGSPEIPAIIDYVQSGIGRDKRLDRW